jgi:hypothetical protein
MSDSQKSDFSNVIDRGMWGIFEIIFTFFGDNEKCKMVGKFILCWNNG